MLLLVGHWRTAVYLVSTVKRCGCRPHNIEVGQDPSRLIPLQGSSLNACEKKKQKHVDRLHNDVDFQVVSIGAFPRWIVHRYYTWDVSTFQSGQTAQKRLATPPKVGLALVTLLVTFKLCECFEIHRTTICSPEGKQYTVHRPFKKGRTCILGFWP